MRRKNTVNPLRRRVIKELLGEWRTYGVISLFLILTIGFISGMYVANGSMMRANENGKIAYDLEDGHFELSERAEKNTLRGIETGTKADIHQYMLEKAEKKFKKKFEPEFKKEFEREFSKNFDSEFNKEFKASFDKKFQTAFQKQFKQNFQSTFRKEFDKEFKKNILASLTAQGLDLKTAKEMLPSALSAAKKDGSYQKAYDTAYQNAKKSSYQKSYRKAYHKAYSPAYQKAYRAAYGKAYHTAYQKAYPKAHDKAYAKSWKKIKKKVDEKYDKVAEKYDLNDTDSPPVPVTLYENFFRNASEDNNGDGQSDGTVRVYSKTSYINQASLLAGHLPETEKEIALDRMHAKNVGCKVGDVIQVSGEDFTVSGLIAFVNYSTLHEKNTDFMFDALKFDVAMVNGEGFARIHTPIHYSYAWKYQSSPQDEAAEKKQSDYFMRALLTQTVVSDCELKDYIPRYANAAVNFAPDDMSGDMTMGGVILYILIAIIAFIFAVSISNTIQREASAIGTLRASGYTRAELTRHYLTMPVIVTLVTSLIGNILGYTLFKKIVVSMYYNSYSLPAYQTVWNGDAFLKTTIIPILLMFTINLMVIVKKMRISPLNFLRHDLKRQKSKRALPLPNLSFMGRFRLRIILQNLPNFAVLFLGIYFVALMLSMAVGMPASLKYYQDHAKSMMFAEHQYVLTDYEDSDGKSIRTSTKGAEQFSMKTLLYKGEKHDEEISVYGISPESRYVKIQDFKSLKPSEVYISASLANKFHLSKGDSFTLDAQYEKERYTFTIAGIYEKSLSISVFMPKSEYQSIFEEKKNAFTGFLSKKTISDLDEDQIATVITEKDISKMADQLEHSMGSIMVYFQYLCILLSAVLIFLLTKLIIEKNEVSISMIKILGYTNGEIFRLYLLSTTIVVILSDAACVLLGTLSMRKIWHIMMQSYTGWFNLHFSLLDYSKIFAFILMGYLTVLFFDFRRIQKIPMDQALKNVE